MYVAFDILQPLVAEIGWSHYLQIMSKCKNDHISLEYEKTITRLNV